MRDVATCRSTNISISRLAIEAIETDRDAIKKAESILVESAIRNRERVLFSLTKT